ncbi:MAG: hypothetical protein RH946_15825 [Rhodospirillales bacterium]
MQAVMGAKMADWQERCEARIGKRASGLTIPPAISAPSRRDAPYLPAHGVERLAR